MSHAATCRTFPPPVMEARRWLSGVSFPPERPLINLSQAAPVAPPPLALRRAIADAALHDATAHLYGPVLGHPELRAEVAARWSLAYGGRIEAEQVAITAGCNQAFCAAIAAIAEAGDEVLLPVPWYFNHKMWLDMAGVRAVPLDPGPDLVPDPAEAAARLTGRTRAIVLVTPNNPAGLAYLPATLDAFLRLCRERGLALILDETYRDFHGESGAPHRLFAEEAWDETLIHLYSFSKAFRLTGHRVGALVAAPQRLEQAEKFLDTVAICPPQIGQRAALWGLRNLGDWLAGERAEVIARGAAIRAVLDALPGWRLRGCGAYFAYAEHPYETSSDRLAPHLVRAAGVLLLPGTMFRPADDPRGAREVRIAFANADASSLAELGRRLADVALPESGPET